MKIYTLLCHQDKLPTKVRGTYERRDRADDRLTEAKIDDEDDNHKGRSYEIVETELE